MPREWGKPLSSFCANEHEFEEWGSWNSPAISQKIRIRPKKRWKIVRPVLELAVLVGIGLLMAHSKGIF